MGQLKKKDWDTIKETLRVIESKEATNPFLDDEVKRPTLYEVDPRSSKRIAQELREEMGPKTNQFEHMLAKDPPYTTIGQYSNVPKLDIDPRRAALQRLLGKDIVKDTAIGVIIPESAGPKEDIIEGPTGKVIEESGRDTIDKLLELPSDMLEKLLKSKKGE
jgi:hypothetical protein